jgi:hypothetical protein
MCAKHLDPGLDLFEKGISYKIWNVNSVVLGRFVICTKKKKPDDRTPLNVKLKIEEECRKTRNTDYRGRCALCADRGMDLISGCIRDQILRPRNYPGDILDHRLADQSGECSHDG